MASRGDRCAGILWGLCAGDRNGGPVEMATALADSLVACCRYDSDDTGRRYLAWFAHGEGVGAWDSGPIAGKVFRLCDGRAERLSEAAAQVNREMKGMTAGANACHRSPALAMSLDVTQLAQTSSTDAALTHASALAGASSIAVVVICRQLLLGADLATATTVAAQTLGAAAPSIVEALLAAPSDREKLSDGGFCVDVLTAALHFAWAAQDFVSGLEAALSFAGPANYCPVLVGAFLGARFGKDATRPVVDSFLTTASHDRDQYAHLKRRVCEVSEKLSSRWSENETLTSDSSLLTNLDDSLVCEVLLCLHGFTLAGNVPCACRRLHLVSGHEGLRAHVFDRDLAPETAVPTPPQPFRFRREELLLSSSLPSTSEEPCALRAIAGRLVGKGALCVAQVAAKEGRASLLHWAAQRVRLDNIDSQGRSALILAAMQNTPRTMAVAAQHCDLEQENGDKGTALHASAYVGAAAAVSTLCRCRANTEARNRTFLQTPLMVGCSRGHNAVVEALLAAGADTTARDRDGLTPVRLSQMMRNESVHHTLSLHNRQD